MGRLGKVDPSSYAEPEKINTLHSSLIWQVDFTNTKLKGSVTHKFDVLEKNLDKILLDIEDIKIWNAVVLSGGSELPINHFVTDHVPEIGSKLTLELPEGAALGELLVRLDYETSSNASALQWLTPEQTLGKNHPYMYSQCQAIHARSILPCQDTPAVKFTYTATIEHPKELTTLMSALVDQKSNDGTTSFKQDVPIPAYLLAIAVGNLSSRPLGPNSNVWAEEDILDASAEEFSKTALMLKAATDICGPYVWKQYDLLVMPPSFPYGGMENPCLTFVTPTLLAGDKSLANVVAHEIAHSWTGNLVTNKNFEHFWLNEGFTVFIETKIVGRLEGPKEQDFHMLRNLTDLKDTLNSQLSKSPELTKLVVDLSDIGPESASSRVPYIKGSTFLRHIEELLGGPEVFEPFLRSYLKQFAYKSVVTDDFKGALYDYFSQVPNKKNKLNEIDWDLWLYKEGMPPIIPRLIIRLDYETSSNASALQWLTPEQTLGKNHPYMYSQCQAIHARSILPCQDTPAVKFTYTATIGHPKELTTLMSALVDQKSNDGTTSFKQDVPIPAYLLAIAVGNLSSRPLGPNSNVWAEEDILDASAEEFSKTALMLKAATDICGPYVWKQYDLLVMPPSFPYGGMENPCLTFVTPTLLAGDKSLADVVAHEIAHSWTGNLVTNKNFEHFWLNEGFTVFIETKIVGRLEGPKEQDFHMLRNLTDLQDTLHTQLAKSPELTKLVVDLSDIGPESAFSCVPYNKGSTFLRYIEELLGGPEVFEPFLRSYLKQFAYKSVVTDDFKGALYDYFSQVPNKKNKLNEIDWDLWLYKEGMPPIIPRLDDTLAIVCKELANLWSTKTNAELKENAEVRQKISSHQLTDFLGKLIEHKDIAELNEEKISLLESIYSIKNTQNSEVRFRFVRLCIRAKLMNRMNEILGFANSNFRMKFCRPIYRDLGNWPEARPIAIESFLRVKSQMMSVASHNIAKDLGLSI